MLKNDMNQKNNKNIWKLIDNPFLCVLFYTDMKKKGIINCKNSFINNTKCGVYQTRFLFANVLYKFA